MSCPNCNTNHNPHSEFTEEHYDYEYVDADGAYTHSKCDDEDEFIDAKSELKDSINMLHDVSDIVAALTEMGPDNPSQVNKLISGIAFYDETIIDLYGHVTEAHHGEAPSTLRVLDIDPADVEYVSDLEKLLKVLRGELEDLFYCDQYGEHGAESPLRVLELMRALTKNEPENLVICEFDKFKEARLYDGQNVNEDDYEEARAHVTTIEYPDHEYKYSFLIDRETRKVYLLA